MGDVRRLEHLRGRGSSLGEHGSKVLKHLGRLLLDAALDDGHLGTEGTQGGKRKSEMGELNMSTTLPSISLQSRPGQALTDLGLRGMHPDRYAMPLYLTAWT